MISRPFETICTAAKKPGELNIRLQFQNNDSLHEAELPEIKAPFAALAKMAAWGGLAGIRIKPIDSFMNLKTCKILEPDMIEWQYDQVKVDSRTLFIIQNMAHRLHVHGNPLKTLYFGTGMAQDSNQIHLALPEHYHDLPFELEMEVEDWDIFLKVDFQERVNDPAKRQPFVEAWETWLQVAAVGAFMDENSLEHLAEHAYFIENKPESRSTGLSCSLERCYFSEHGLFCFVNMLYALHEKVIPIEDVRIS